MLTASMTLIMYRSMKGYTREQRDEQEERWYAMTDDYGYAQIEEI